MGPGPAQGEGRGRGAPSTRTPTFSRLLPARPCRGPGTRASGASQGPGGLPPPAAAQSSWKRGSPQPPPRRRPSGPAGLGGAVSAAHFYLRSDFDAKNRAGARASRPPRPAPPWEAGRVPGRVSHVTGCVCVCVPVCVSGTGAPVPCAPPSPGCPGLDSTQGTWPAVTAPGRPLTGAPAGARVGSSTLPQGPPPSAPTARSWPRPAAGGAGVGSAPLC